ncbi:MAG: hypothetical protein GY719_33630 [bacterium]|nr:hypothetical protein [bacterium]
MPRDEYRDNAMLERFHWCANLVFTVAVASVLMSCSSTPKSAADAVPEAVPEETAIVEPAAEDSVSAMIVQGRELEAVVAAVEEVGGTITHRLRIINAVGARLTPAQIAALEQHEAVTRIYADREVGIRSTG